MLNSLKTFSFGLSTERERLKTALDSESQSNVNQSIVNLKNSLNQAIQQNTDLRNRLQKIHDAADIAELSLLDHVSEGVRTFFYDFLQFYIRVKNAQNKNEIEFKYFSSCLFPPNKLSSNCKINLSVQQKGH